ncbi:MAG: HIT domain-containing protein [Dehalococcoidales bacterium]|nr:HIT domain-containing protein [Dehalococcoidales bacterium]
MRRDWYCEDVFSGKLEVKKIWEDENVLVFYHPEPAAERHAVAVPKKHISSLMDPAIVNGDILSSMMTAVQKAAVEMSIDKTGFFLESNAIDPGVTPHVHWHIKSFESKR